MAILECDCMIFNLKQIITKVCDSFKTAKILRLFYVSKFDLSKCARTSDHTINFRNLHTSLFSVGVQLNDNDVTSATGVKSAKYYATLFRGISNDKAHLKGHRCVQLSMEVPME